MPGSESTRVNDRVHGDQKHRALRPVSMPKTNGIEIAMPNLPPMPGIAPTITPNGTASNITPMSSGDVTSAIRLASGEASDMA